MAQAWLNETDLIDAVTAITRRAVDAIFPAGTRVLVDSSQYIPMVQVRVVEPDGQGNFTEHGFSLSRSRLRAFQSPELLARDIEFSARKLYVETHEPRLGDPFRDAVRQAIDPPKPVDLETFVDLATRYQSLKNAFAGVDLLAEFKQAVQKAYPPPIPSSLISNTV